MSKDVAEHISHCIAQRHYISVSYLICSFCLLLSADPRGVGEKRGQKEQESSRCCQVSREETPPSGGAAKGKVLRLESKVSLKSSVSF